jgi:hypothetical protein
MRLVERYLKEAENFHNIRGFGRSPRLLSLYSNQF